MRIVFADTFYWAALTSPDDSFYQKALEFSRLLRPARIVTSDDVLIEYLAFFARAGPGVRFQAGHLVSCRVPCKTPVFCLFLKARKPFLAALDLYLARPDKAYSLTNCISMVIMRCEGLTEILTHDRHFEQEGFRSLFRDS